MDKLLIFPCNGNAIEAIECIAGHYELIGFVDDEVMKQGTYKCGFKVYARDAILRYREAKVLAVPGSPSSYFRRKGIIEGLEISNDRFACVIHPEASISPLAKLGFNTLVMSGVVVTSNAVIGNHVCILPNSVVHHDTVINDYCLIGSCVTVAGGVQLGQNCYVGSGSRIIHGTSIGQCALIGLGANVIRSVDAYSKVVGNPARKIGVITAS